MDHARKQRIEQAVALKGDEIVAIDEAFFGDVIGIAQASGQLREALDKLDQLINQREYDKAADLGYTDIASEFIFLQRCLGALNDTSQSVNALVSDTILQIGTALEDLSYEEVAPFIEEKMQSLQPREPLPVENVDFQLELNADVVKWFRAQGGDHKAHMAKLIMRHYVKQRMPNPPKKETV